jgi:hypothetical protein
MRRYVTGLNFLAPDVGCADPFARLSMFALLTGDTSLQSSLDNAALARAYTVRTAYRSG